MGAEQERRMDLEELDRELDCSLVVGQEETMDELVAGDSFGFSTAISGDTAMVVSAFHRDGRGAVYVFDRMPDGGWLETDKLLQAHTMSLAAASLRWHSMETQP